MKEKREKPSRENGGAGPELDTVGVWGRFSLDEERTALLLLGKPQGEGTEKGWKREKAKVEREVPKEYQTGGEDYQRRGGTALLPAGEMEGAASDQIQ